MATDRELLQMALDALELTGVEYLTQKEIDHLDALEIALRARLAQPEQDDGYCQACEGDNCTAKNGCVALDNPIAQPEQDPVAMVVSKTGDLSVTMSWWHEPALPVGIPLYTTPPQREVYCGCGDEIVAGDGARCGTCVAVKYKEKEWQGLTDEEIGAMEKEYLFGGKEFDDEIGYWAVYRAIEAKLKQKNYQSALHNMNKAAEKNGEEL